MDNRAWQKRFKDAEKDAAKSEEARTQLRLDCLLDGDTCLALLLKLDPHDLEERLSLIHI